MQTATVQHVARNQRMNGGQCYTGMTDQISQCRQAEIDTFSRNPIGLPVQWLVLSWEAGLSVPVPRR